MTDKKQKTKVIKGKGITLRPEYVVPKGHPMAKKKASKTVRLPMQVIVADKARSTPKRKAAKSKWHVEVGKAELKSKGGGSY